SGWRPERTWDAASRNRADRQAAEMTGPGGSAGQNVRVIRTMVEKGKQLGSHPDDRGGPLAATPVRARRRGAARGAQRLRRSRFPLWRLSAGAAGPGGTEVCPGALLPLPALRGPQRGALRKRPRARGHPPTSFECECSRLDWGMKKIPRLGLLG